MSHVFNTITGDDWKRAIAACQPNQIQMSFKEKHILIYAYLYHSGTPVISDGDYDRLKRDAAERCAPGSLICGPTPSDPSWYSPEIVSFAKGVYREHSLVPGGDDNPLRRAV